MAKRMPSGMGGMGGGNMMKQVQRMQQEMVKAQQEVEEQQFEASVGGGVVSVTVTGARQIVSVTLSPDAVDPDDVEMLQDLIVAATNEALKKAESAMENAIGRFTGGLGLGGLM